MKDNRRRIVVALALVALLVTGFVGTMAILSFAQEGSDQTVYSDADDKQTYEMIDGPVPLAADDEEKKMKEKFEIGFYEKIDKLEKKGEKRDYKVMIFTYPDTDVGGVLDPVDDSKKNKEKLESVLKEKHMAKEIYKAQVFSFIAAELPIEEIKKLSDYDYVQQIADREVEGIAVGTASALEVTQAPGSPGPGPFAGIVSQNPVSTDMDNLRYSINADGTGYDGTGIRVAVVDTGIRQDHPDLPVGTKILYQADCSTGSTCKPYTGQNDAVKDTVNHGTQIAGIIAAGTASNQFRGVAYGATLINAKIGLNIGNMGIAFDWAISSPRNAKVINISIATSCSNGYNSFARIADEAVEKGVVVVAPTGVGTSGILAPGCAYNVITVGAVDDMGNFDRTDDALVTDNNYNTWGPTADGLTKPDVVAPGMNIWTTYFEGDLYGLASGASHASAATAGAAAQVLDKFSWTPAQVKAALKQKAYLNTPLSALPEQMRGKGMVDIASTLTLTSSTINYLLAYAIPTSFPYTVESRDGTSIEYKISRDGFSGSSNIGGLYLTDLKLNGIAISGIQEFTGVKTASSWKTPLTDNELFSGPRIDTSDAAGSQAHFYIKYKVSGAYVKIIYFMQTGSIQGRAQLDSTGSAISFEAVQLMDLDLSSSYADDKATIITSPYTAHQYEKEFLTGTNFNWRNNVKTEQPWLRFNYASGGSSPNEWILKRKSITTEPPTNTPHNYFSSTESINGSGSGTDIQFYYSDKTTSAVSYYSGFTLIVNWSTAP